MSPDLPRRAVIAGGIVLSAAACSSSTTPATPGSTAPASASAAGSVVKKSDVPVGGGYIMPKGSYVVTQPKAGTYKAFSKICTHQSCPVSQITGGTINCTCHGSKFSIEDGSVKQGPATKPLPAAKVTESGDDLSVTA